MIAFIYKDKNVYISRTFRGTPVYTIDFKHYYNIVKMIKVIDKG